MSPEEASAPRLSDEPDRRGAEEAMLRERVMALAAQFDERGQSERVFPRGEIDAVAMLDAIPALVFSKTRDHRYAFINRAYGERFKVSVEGIVGKLDEDVYPLELAQAYRDSDEVVMATGVPRWNVETYYERDDGSVGCTLENHIPLRDASGKVTGMVGAMLDVTDRKRAEEALLCREAELRAALERQACLLETVMALSAPVLPIDDRILVLPLVGHIDEARQARIMEALLAGVQRYGAEFVILDLTGVPVVDAAIADHLLRAVQAVNLLGAQVIVVGLSPKVARSLIEVGVDLRGLVTLCDLQTGVRHAQRARGINTS